MTSPQRVSVLGCTAILLLAGGCKEAPPEPDPQVTTAALSERHYADHHRHHPHGRPPRLQCRGRSEGTPCDDGDECTQVDVCVRGECIGTQPVECSPLDQCHVAGTCDPDTGICSDPLQVDGVACDDGNACTGLDSCQDGACVGVDPVECLALDQCHAVGTCDPASGLCSDPAQPDGVACADDNPCTFADACRGGVCAGVPLVCSADQCHVSACDMSTGACVTQAKINGTPCTDGNGCTQLDTCQAGVCAGGQPVVCAGPDQCHLAGVCNTSTGTCSRPSRLDGTPCAAGDVCTSGGTCQGGICNPGNSSGSSPDGIALTGCTQGDYDGDGTPDCARFMIGTTLRYDVVFNKGVGPNLFSPACGVTHSPVSADLVTPGGSGVVGVIDLNHDGRADIVFYFQDPAGLGKISLQLFRGEADGIFFPFPPPSPGQQGLGPVLGVLVTGTAVADFDRDGTPDLLALVTDTNLFAQWYYVVIKSSGGLDFQFAQTLAFPSVRGPVYLGGVTDLNNDGILDVVSMSLSTSPLTFFLGTVGLSFGNGDGTFASVITLPSVNQAAALDVSDANGDGKVDLIVRRQSGTPTTFFGDGAGHFSTTPP